MGTANRPCAVSIVHFGPQLKPPASPVLQIATRTFLAAPLIALAALAAGGCGDAPRRANAACGATLSTPREIGIERAGEATLCLINGERSRRGLGALAPSERLAAAAVAHSRDMVARGYFEHETPEGRTPQDRIRASGWGRGTSSSTGENIAWGTGDEATPAAIVREWMASPPHRADILRPAFREIGVGIAFGAPGRDGSRDDGATYTTTFGGAFDPSLDSG